MPISRGQRVAAAIALGSAAAPLVGAPAAVADNKTCVTTGPATSCVLTTGSGDRRITRVDYTGASSQAGRLVMTIKGSSGPTLSERSGNIFNFGTRNAALTFSKNSRGVKTVNGVATGNWSAQGLYCSSSGTLIVNGTSVGPCGQWPNRGQTGHNDLWIEAAFYTPSGALVSARASDFAIKIK